MTFSKKSWVFVTFLWIFTYFPLLIPLLRAESKALITSSHTDIQANQIIAPYLDPPPGREVYFFEGDLRDRKTSDALNLRGFITVRPPKGRCFTVTTHRDREDRIVCKETSLAWLAKDLGADGSIRWKISTGENDFGRTYVWNSPYRIAQTIALGKGDQHDLNLHVVLGCENISNSDGNYIQINLHRNRFWRLYFPKKHELTKAKEETKSEIKDDKPKKEDTHGAEKTKPKEEDKTKSDTSESSTKLATEIWNISEINSYEMNSSYFRTADGTSHNKGTCRYQAKGAAQDKSNGWFECHHTGSFEVVFSHLTCKIQGLH